MPTYKIKSLKVFANRIGLSPISATQDARDILKMSTTKKLRMQTKFTSTE